MNLAARASAIFCGTITAFNAGIFIAYGDLQFLTATIITLACTLLLLHLSRERTR